MTKVAVLDDIHAAFRDLLPLQRLRRRVEVVIYTEPLRPPQRAQELHDVEIVIALRERTRFDAAFFQDAPALRLISQTGGVGPHLDLQAATEAGVLVATTRDPNPSIGTVELTFALMMAVMRQIPHSDRNLREGRWITPFGKVLHGKTLGIIGFGRIGREVARIARAFGMEVVAWSRSLSPEAAQAVGVRAVSLEELLQRSDIVTLHLALNEGTRGFLNAARLSLLKRDAYLINTSRGAIVDEEALVRRLEAGELAGAGLDVFTEEPLPSTSPLLKLPNVVLTPHVGWPTDHGYATFAEGAVRNIEAYLDGTPTNIVNPEALTRLETRR